MSSPFARLSLVLSLFAIAGCPSTPDTDAGLDDASTDAPLPGAVPPLRNPMPDVTDAELAMMSLRIMGAPEAGATATLCNDCHDLTRAQIHYWSTLTIHANETCVADATLAGGDTAATEVITCVRGGRADARFNPDNLGIFATAADLDWFQYVFEHGVSAGDWAAVHAQFLSEAGMPRDYPPLTQAQFDTLAEWFLRGAPEADAILPAETRPTGCTANVTDDVRAYVMERSTDSWTTANAASGMLMYGCAGATSPEGCLADETLASTTAYGADWDDTGASGVPGARMRVLYELDYESSYWTRSSADGRFVSHGTFPGLRFIDLASGTGPLTGRTINGNADYDPFFFPDDRGFVVQSEASGPHVCEMRVLTTGMPTSLDFDSVAGCVRGGAINLYEHLGAALGGGDYWAIDSVGAGFYAEYDPGDADTRENPATARFSANAQSTIRFLTNDGTSFHVSGSEIIDHPYEGDAVISPSLGLILTRQAGPSSQAGYVLRRVSVSGTGSSRTISTTPVAHYCVSGGKPGFSYDERFAVLHHYIENTDADAMALGFTGASDPGFAAYRTMGGANVYMIELATGTMFRVTNMGPGQFALFPHFRSDGWIYFLHRGGGPEHIVASDAALLVP